MCVTEGRFNCKLSTAEEEIVNWSIILKKTLRVQHRDGDRKWLSGLSKEQNPREVLIFLLEKGLAPVIVGAGKSDICRASCKSRNSSWS